MRWPWVSRAAYDQLRVELAEERGQRSAAQNEVLEWASKYHQTRDRLKEIQIAGAMIRTAETERMSPVARVIREQAQGPDGREDLGLARHLRTYASRLKREGKNDDEIVGALVSWQTTEAD